MLLLLLTRHCLRLAAAAADAPAAAAAAAAASPAAAAAAAADPPATVACIWFKGTTWSPNAPRVIAISTYVENEVILLSTVLCRSNTL